MNGNCDQHAKLCELNSLSIGGTVFKHKDIHKYKWTSPNNVDYVYTVEAGQIQCILQCTDIHILFGEKDIRL